VDQAEPALKNGESDVQRLFGLDSSSVPGSEICIAIDILSYLSDQSDITNMEEFEESDLRLRIIYEGISEVGCISNYSDAEWDEMCKEADGCDMVTYVLEARRKLGAQ
jgi:hypothetical protein